MLYTSSSRNIKKLLHTSGILSMGVFGIIYIRDKTINSLPGRGTGFMVAHYLKNE
jgi:hypothetical protein